MSHAAEASVVAKTSVRSDALVLFGATGDLAFKKIFPALQSMLRRGRLDVPAKAGWNLEQLRERARASLEQHGSSADYIPALAKVDPNLFGIALVMADDKVHTAGDVATEVSIQSSPRSSPWRGSSRIRVRTPS